MRALWCIGATRRQQLPCGGYLLFTAGRYAAVSVQGCKPRNALSTQKSPDDKADSVIKANPMEEQSVPVKKYEHIPYVTRANYEKQRMYPGGTTLSRTADKETGHAPTKRQRHLLVITRVFDSYSEIPEYINFSALKKMYNRMRVIVVLVACILLFSMAMFIEMTGVRKMQRDRNLLHGESQRNW